MTKLTTLEEFRDTWFSPESKPSLQIIRGWARNGKLPVVKFGKRYYVQTEKLPTGNAMADKILHYAAPQKS